MLSGLATHYVPSQLLPQVDASVAARGAGAADAGRVRAVLNDYQSRTPLPQGTLPGLQTEIDALFGGKASVEEVHEACRRAGGAFAKEALALLNK